MCLIVFDWQPTARIRLKLAANRDEFHARPTEPLHRWPDAPLIGGRDLRGGGTWLAAAGKARFAALTNVREGLVPVPADAPSRGGLVRGAIEAPDLEGWLERLAAAQARHYAGFNLLAMNGDRLWHLHHSQDATYLETVPPGLHGLSNASLDTPWPKLLRAREALKSALAAPDWRQAMWPAMGDTRPADDAELPDTGVGLARERFLSSVFIDGEDYGTRSTTLATVTASGRTTLEERRYGPHGRSIGDTQRLSIA